MSDKKRVTGFGGIFFKCDDPKSVREWYSTHLGLNTDQYGCTFNWRDADSPKQMGSTQWSPFKADTKYFEPSTQPFMMNFRVENLEWLVGKLREEGVTILDEMESYEYGKFIHIMDNAGNKIELWEAPSEEKEIAE